MSQQESQEQRPENVYINKTLIPTINNYKESCENMMKMSQENNKQIDEQLKSLDQQKVDAILMIDEILGLLEKERYNILEEDTSAKQTVTKLKAEITELLSTQPNHLNSNTA